MPLMPTAKSIRDKQQIKFNELVQTTWKNMERAILETCDGSLSKQVAVEVLIGSSEEHERLVDVIEQCMNSSNNGWRWIGSRYSVRDGCNVTVIFILPFEK